MDSIAESVQRLSLQFPPLVIAIVFHEVAHAFMATRWGDQTAKSEGRLTLNPVPHIDPMGTIFFPMLMMLMSSGGMLFGWAKPVPINPSRFRKYRAGLFWVSFAGPAMNFLLALFSALLFSGIRKWVPTDFYLYEPLVAMSYVSVSLNIALAVFNLIPLPPLDGSKMIQSFLSFNATQKYESIAQYSFFILMALMFTGAFAILHGPIRFITQITLLFSESLFQL